MITLSARQDILVKCCPVYILLKRKQIASVYLRFYQTCGSLQDVAVQLEGEVSTKPTATSTSYINFDVKMIVLLKSG